MWGGSASADDQVQLIRRRSLWIGFLKQSKKQHPSGCNTLEALEVFLPSAIKAELLTADIATPFRCSTGSPH